MQESDHNSNSLNAFKRPLDLALNRKDELDTAKILREQTLSIQSPDAGQKTNTATQFLPAITVTGLGLELVKATVPGEGDDEEKEKEKPKKKTTIEVGERFAFDGGLHKFLASDSQAKVAILETPNKAAGEPQVISETRANIANNYTTVALGDRYVYVNKDGKVFESAGGDKLKEVQGVKGVTAEKLPVIVPKPSFEDEDIFDEGLKKRTQWQDKTASETVDGQKVTITADKNGTRRTITVAGQNYELTAKKGLWYTHLGIPGPDGPVKKTDGLKLHVTIGSSEGHTASEDLKRVQAALIPALEEASKKGGKLYGKLHGYKTLDPMYGMDSNWSEREPHNSKLPRGSHIEPGSTGQEAKGFTIYPASDEHAKEISEFCSQVLKEKGLSFDAPQKTGNIGDKFVDADTHRVSVDKDYWKGYEIGNANQRYYGAALEPELEAGLKKYAEQKVASGDPDWGRFKEKGIYEGDPKFGRLSSDALSQIIADAKIDRWECGLTYAKGEGGEPKLVFYSGEEQLHGNGKYYLDEAGARKEPVYEGRRLVKGLNGRPAMYELARMVGDQIHQDLSPARLQMNALEREKEKKALEGSTVDKRLLNEDTIAEFHKQVQRVKDDLVEAPQDAGDRLRKQMLDLMTAQGIKDPRLTNENNEIVVDAKAKTAKAEHLVDGAPTALNFDGTNYVTEDGKKIAPDRVAIRITIPAEMLGGSPSQLAKTVYSAWVGQSVTGEQAAAINRGLESHIETTLAASAKLDPTLEHPHEAGKAGLNTAESPKAERKPAELTIGDTGAQVPGVGEHFKFADIWKARVDQVRDELDAEKAKTGSEHSAERVAALESKLKAEQATYQALSNSEHPNHQAEVAAARKELGSVRLRQAELDAAREAGGFGARGRFVILTALAAALLSLKGH